MASSRVDLAAVLVAPIVEIVLSLVLGALLGLCLACIERVFHSNRNRVALITRFVILGVALSMLEFEVGGVEVSFSSLLVLMMLGTVFCNVCDSSEDLMNRADKWSAPMLTLFFVLSGAALDLGVFSDVAIVGIGLVYIVARSLGKYLGAGFSSKLAHQSSEVQKYLGITLLPQAGVALGMSAQVGTSAAMGATGPMVRNIVLFGVLIYELVGPSLTKWALTKAGDTKPKQ